jgi:hypothetical protein
MTGIAQPLVIAQVGKHLDALEGESTGQILDADSSR